ncbi:hypothetical protein FKM82_007961 [Ascaphus truei]
MKTDSQGDFQAILCFDSPSLSLLSPFPPPQFDSESSGYISTEQFWTLLQRHGSELDPHKLDVLLALAENRDAGKIGYQDFVNLMSNKRSNSFRRAILQGNRRLCSKALLEESGLGLAQRLIRHVAYETLPREIDRKWFYDNYTGCPPPWFMIAVTIVEVAFFVYYGLVLDRFVLQVTHPLYLNRNPLVYHPQLRAQAWRYLSYMFMHAGTSRGERGSPAAGRDPPGDGPRSAEDQLRVHRRRPGRFIGRVGG